MPARPQRRWPCGGAEANLLDPIGVGIVGAGHIAPQHAEALRGLEEARLIAVCDIVEGKAETLADRFGAPKVYDDVEKLVRDPDIEAICVTTPHKWHAPPVVAAAGAGVHALSEKPMAADLADCDRMIEAHRKAGTKLGVIFQRRWSPGARRIRDAIDAGKFGERLVLGDCVFKGWRGPDYYALDLWRGRWDTEGGGVLLNQSIHSIDLLQWYMGPVNALWGQWGNMNHPYVEVEDTACAVLRFKSGALGVIENSVSQNPQVYVKVAVHGSNGASADVVLEGPHAEEGANEIWTIPGEEAPGREPAKPIGTSRAAVEYHRAQIQDFLQAIREDRQPVVNGEEGRKSIEIITAIYRSQATGEVVRFPVPTDDFRG